jgi:hypothetical protein
MFEYMLVAFWMAVLFEVLLGCVPFPNRLCQEIRRGRSIGHDKRFGLINLSIILVTTVALGILYFSNEQHLLVNFFVPVAVQISFLLLIEHSKSYERPLKESKLNQRINRISIAFTLAFIIGFLDGQASVFIDGPNSFVKSTSSFGPLLMISIFFCILLVFLINIPLIISQTCLWVKNECGPIHDYVLANIDIPKQKSLVSLVILVSLAITFSIFNLNDNHKVRLIDSNPEVKVIQPLRKEFDKWLDVRADSITKYLDKGNKKYPLYIVSAQGGGIYAAYHAASALGHLQEVTEGDFSEHIFAISSTSGGSLGAAVFAGLVKRYNDEAFKKGSFPFSTGAWGFTQNSDKVLRHDFLSPLLGATLFPDFVQRFLPLRLNALDRARALEYAFESAWATELGSEQNFFQESFYEYWEPEDNVPALVMNTTIVETGEQLLISPFSVSLPYLKSIDYYDSCINFRLSTAVGLSARFPFVTPVGWFKKRREPVEDPKTCPIKRSADGPTIRLADGGYFENSGVSTALAIGRELQKVIDERKLTDKTKIVYLAIIESFQPSDQRLKENAGGVLNESLSPVRALGAVRSARAQSVVCQAEQSENKSNDPDQEIRQCNNIDVSENTKFEDDNFRKLLLAKLPGRLPLGWSLSGAAQDSIECQVGMFEDTTCSRLSKLGSRPDSNNSQGSNKDYVRDWEVRDHNKRVVESVKAELELA